MRLGGSVLGAFLVLGCGGPSTAPQQPGPAPVPPARASPGAPSPYVAAAPPTQAQQEARRSECDPQTIDRAEIAFLWSASQLISCPEQQPRYEARLLALFEGELARDPACRRTDLPASNPYTWHPSDAFKRRQGEIMASIRQRCSSWMVGALRAANYRNTPEIQAAMSYLGGMGETLDCALAMEMYDHAIANPAARAAIRELAGQLGMRALHQHFLSGAGPYSLPRSKMVALLRNGCTTGARQELARHIITGGAPPAGASPALEPVPPPLPQIGIPAAPACGGSTPEAPTTVRIAITKCYEVKFEQTSETRGYVGTCRDGVNKCYFGPATVTKTNTYPIADVVISVWLDGQNLSSRAATVDADGPRLNQATRLIAEELLAEARRNREIQRNLATARNRDRQVEIDAGSARRAQIPAARRKFDQARTAEEREEAAAEYVLAGGRERHVLDELARLYGIKPQPGQWPWSEAR
jgi:hypothetical protein